MSKEKQIQDYKRYTDFTILDLIKAIRHSTPIPDNATNGDVIKALFPNEHDFETDFDEEWINAPYQKDGTTRKNCEYRHENGNCLKVGGFCMSVDDEHCEKGGK